MNGKSNAKRRKWGNLLLYRKERYGRNNYKLTLRSNGTQYAFHGV
jgi:hypothetical protein